LNANEQTAGSNPAPAQAAPGRRWAVPFAIGSTIIIWASAFVAIRAGLRGYSPVHLAVLRFVAASALFGIRAVSLGIGTPRKRDWPRVLVTGIVGFTTYTLLVNIGETRVNAGMASFVVNTGPVFTAILAVLFLGERMRGLGWLGLAISMTGAALLAFGAHSRFDFEPYVLVLLAAAIVQATYFALQKPLVNRYGAVTITSWAIWSGTLFLLPFLPSALKASFHAPLTATLAALYLAVFPTVIGYAAWAWVASRGPIGQATAYLYFVPIVATLIGWVALRESPTLLEIIGGLITICGVALVNLRLGGQSSATPLSISRR
jgi:drug/metabolite transporter (DMT)-like permease